MPQRLKRYTVGSVGLYPEKEGEAYLVSKVDIVLAEYEAREQRLRELVDKWIVEQSEYPPEGALAAAAVRVCVRELRAILNEGEKP